MGFIMAKIFLFELRRRDGQMDMPVPQSLNTSRPMRGRKPQRPCDIGLFSDEADQLDLVEMFQEPAED